MNPEHWEAAPLTPLRPRNREAEIGWAVLAVVFPLEALVARYLPAITALLKGWLSR